jgi:thymidylate synthase ThyX
MVKYHLKYISTDQLKEALKTVNVAFLLEEIDRVQSTLICELKDSYVQQSQRYVTMGPDGYNQPQLNEIDLAMANILIKKAFDLYNRMTEFSDETKQLIAEGKKKGRPQIIDYKYGIPIEDGRYILPLACRTNISVAMSGDKLVDFIRLLTDPLYNGIMDDILKELKKIIPKNILSLIPDKIPVPMGMEAVDELYKDYFECLDSDNNEKMVYISSFENEDLRVAAGALTSTQGVSPLEVIDKWGENKEEKAQGVNSRVLGYGHSGIAEQARTIFAMMCSLTCYHQQIRHRLPAIHRENLLNIIKDQNRPVVVPESIKKSPFYNEFMALVNEFKIFRNRIMPFYDSELVFPLLLNCDQVKLLISTNARIDELMLRDRTCMTAQWEIRGYSVEKLQYLRQLSTQLYEKALPPCVYGACKEGALSCKKQEEVKEFFKKL